MTHPSLPRLLPLMLAAVLAVGGCAREIDPTVVSGPSVGATTQTYRGTIESVRAVLVQESDTLEGNRTGLLLGGLAGAAAGSRAGSGFGKTVMTGVGAVAGAGAGALAERELKRQQGYEYVVRTETGQLFTVVQGGPRLSPGQSVYVQLPSRGRATVVPY